MYDDLPEEAKEAHKFPPFNEETGLEHCPFCGVVYSANGGYTGPVYDFRGHFHERYYDTDPGRGPFYCKQCWKEHGHKIKPITRAEKPLDKFKGES